MPKRETPQNLQSYGSPESISLVSVDKIKRVLEEKPSSQQSEKENTAKTSEDSKFKSEKNSTMLSNPIESHYSREQDLRYTSLSDVSRSISSYAIDTVASNRLAMPDYDVQTVHSTNHRPYDPGSLINTQTAFERYDPNYPLQRTSMYSSYGQPSLEELASQQKYLLEHSQQQQTPIMKTEPDENSGPIYPRPIYQSYDPTGTNKLHNLNWDKRKLIFSQITDGKFYLKKEKKISNISWNASNILSDKLISWKNIWQYL